MKRSYKVFRLLTVLLGLSLASCSVCKLQYSPLETYSQPPSDFTSGPARLPDSTSTSYSSLEHIAQPDPGEIQMLRTKHTYSVKDHFRTKKDQGLLKHSSTF